MNKKFKIKTGDTVIVITGKDKGKKGEVIRLLDNNKCLVSAINMAKKHTKPNPNAGIEGGIIEKEMPIELSNIMLFNPVTKKQDRVGFKKLESGKKVRIYKSFDSKNTPKGIRLCQYDKTKSKYFVLQYWFNNKATYLTLGEFLDSKFGTKECLEKYYKIFSQIIWLYL